MKRVATLLLLLLLGGCAYYNGMYNARRMAARARQAEKEDRTFDATSLWGQVGVKAESVLAQHPNSKWADEARLLQGTSLIKLRNCALGVRPLEQLLAVSTNPKLTEEAAVLLGGCRTTLGDPAGALAMYGRLTGSKDPERRRLALFAHGRAQRIDGNYEAALNELNNTDYPGSQGERAAALAGLGRLPETMVLVDSLIVAGDSAAPWDSLLAAVTRHDPDAGARLVDRVADSDMPRALLARMLMTEGERLRESDPVESEARLAEAEKLGVGTQAGNEARFQAVLLKIRTVEELSQFKELVTRIEDLSEGTGSVAPRAAQLAGFAHRVALTADSVPAGSPTGDLRLFLAGEMARDSLNAEGFAAQQFRRVVTEWPSSPFAPKALLALIVLQPDRADSLRTSLLATYPGSPYVAMIEGGDSPEYAVLEDSLRRFAISFRPEGRNGPGRVQQQQRPTTAPREPVNR
jgi:hypothetical protein